MNIKKLFETTSFGLRSRGAAVWFGSCFEGNSWEIQRAGTISWGHMGPQQAAGLNQGFELGQVLARILRFAGQFLVVVQRFIEGHLSW